MWKVVVTEIQDANVLEPSTVPPGAFFVTAERFSRTVDSLDLETLISALDRMQSAQVCRGEDRPISGHRDTWRAGPLTSFPNRPEAWRSAARATATFSQTDP
jgi:hypothetical protein